MLINCTNHRYEIWSDEQKRAAAAEFGEVYELPFPAVVPDAVPSDLRKLVDEYMEKIRPLNPKAVLVAGEFSFCFMLVDKLKKEGYKAVTTCSRRETAERKTENGTEKIAKFVFEGFREYEYY